MPASSPLRNALLALLIGAAPLVAQDEHRIWGSVETVSGEVLEGFIRWDRNEGSWVDVLDGGKDVPDHLYESWREAWEAGERPTRTVEMLGYRISWNEDDPEFPQTAASGIRFGHLASLRVTASDRAELTLKSGEVVEFVGGSTDLGWDMRELIVEEPGLRRDGARLGQPAHHRLLRASSRTEGLRLSPLRYRRGPVRDARSPGTSRGTWTRSSVPTSWTARKTDRIGRSPSRTSASSSATWGGPM